MAGFFRREVKGRKLNPIPAFSTTQYVDSGHKLIQMIVERISLSDWADGRPKLTETEQRFLDETLQSFWEGSNASARRQGGEKLSYHPEFWEYIERALQEFALRECGCSQTRDGNWQSGVSAYLKAWLSGLNPRVLLEIAQVLRKHEVADLATIAVDTASLFPAYQAARPYDKFDFTKMGYITAKACAPRHTMQKDVSDPDFIKELKEEIGKQRDRI